MRKLQRTLATVLALSGTLVAVLALNVGSRAEYEKQAYPSVQPRHSVSTGAVTEDRPVYRNSVVPGGVYSDIEAQAAAQRDATVRAHYRPINLQRLRPVVLDRQVDRYVSFRKEGLVYWTSRRVRIPAGEVLLADSDSLIRARCGNRLAETPQSPTVPAGVAEPADSELSAVQEKDTQDGSAAPQPLLPSVHTTQASSVVKPQALAPVAGTGATAAAAAVMNPDQVLYPDSDVPGGGMPAPGAAAQSITEASTLTPRQIPAEVPRFDGPRLAPVDPTEVVWGGLPACTPAGPSVSGPGNSQGSNSRSGGSSSLAGGSTGGSSVGSPAVPSSRPESGYILPDKPAWPSELAPVSRIVGGSELAGPVISFQVETPEPSTLAISLAGLGLFGLSRRR